MRCTICIAVGCVLSVPFAAPAQSNIDPSHKYAWAENGGWLNWYDAGSPAGAEGVVVHGSFLSGFVWAENLGWINLGNGHPADGVHYANTSGTDFGVNIDADTGELYGLAWGENIGWINFAGGALASPPIPARLDRSTCRLAGFVWGENVAWINLDDETHYVGIDADACLALAGDMNCDRHVDFDDINPFVTALVSWAGYQAQFPDCRWLNGDCNGDGHVDFDDINPFVACLVNGGCP